MRRTLHLVVAAFALVAVGCAPNPGGGGGGSSAPVITSSTYALPVDLRVNFVNQPYTTTLAATGTGPITWSVASGTLPEGLTLSAGGVLSGTPTDNAYVNQFTPFTVRATNAAGSATKSLRVRIMVDVDPASEVPIGTGVPLPGGGSIAFSHSPAGGGINSITLWAYRADGTIASIPSYLAGNLTSPTEPNPRFFSDLEQLSTDLSHRAQRTVAGNQIQLTEPYDLDGQAVLTTFPDVLTSPSATFSPDGAHVAITGFDATTVSVYSTSSPYALERLITLSGPIFGGFDPPITWDRDSSRLAVTVSSSLAVYGTTNPAYDTAPPAYFGCRVGAFGPAHRLATLCVNGDGSGSIVTGETDGSSRTEVYRTATSSPLPVAFSPDGTQLALRGGGPLLRIVSSTAPWNPAHPPTALTVDIPGGGSTSNDGALDWIAGDWAHA